MNNSKLQIGIYKVDTNHECFDDCDSAIETLSTAIQKEDVAYDLQSIQDNLTADYEIVLLYKKNPQNPKWKQFLSSIAEDNENVLKDDQSWAESFILLFTHNDKDNLYAVCGGLGFFAIQDVIEDDFGIDIISRLIKKE
ncbi:MAG: DUF6119 family protein, partial [Candidatus Bathyarchaeia archaeon]